MAPSRTSRLRYNYSEDVQTAQIPCPHCGKCFKRQGFKKHESGCKQRAAEDEQRLSFNNDFENSTKKARRTARQRLYKVQDNPEPVVDAPSANASLEPRVRVGYSGEIGEGSSGPSLPTFDEGFFPSDETNPGVVPPIAAEIQDPGSPPPASTGSPWPTGERRARSSTAPSDVSMSTVSADQQISGPPSAQHRPQEFKTVYHPRSGRAPLQQSYEEFRITQKVVPPEDETPWRPFRDPGDFEFAEVALDAALNAAQVNKLLNLISRVAAGTARVTLKNYADLQNSCDAAAAELTPFCKHEITEVYKGEPRSYEVHTRPLWSWALDLLENPLLAPHFVWDAERLYKHNGTDFERFYDEPWTGDRWWDVQSSLPPDVENAVPFGIILYADKTKLSSFGSVKGYPVIARCANLPVGLRNSQGIGGGCIVGWLPIVPEDAEEEGKLGYTTLKRVIWHDSFTKLLDEVATYSRTGYVHISSYDKVIRTLFAVILILSGDYEEQCMMSLIRGRLGKCPCPICLVPLEQLHDISQTYPNRSMVEAQDALDLYRHSRSAGNEALKALGLRPVENVFWRVRDSDPHQALSFDQLHYLDGRLGGKHLLNECKKVLAHLGRPAEAAVELYVKEFPRWRNLTHFSTMIHLSFSDGNKLRDLVKVSFYAGLGVLKQSLSPEGYCILRLLSSYLKLHAWISLDIHTERTLRVIQEELHRFDTALKSYMQAVDVSNIEGLRSDWDFPKAHLWKHVIQDIRNKGAVRNYSTRPNEGMHVPLKEAYEQTNGKDVATQILRINHRKLATKLIRMRIDHLAHWNTLAAETDEDPDEPDSDYFNGHYMLGAQCKLASIQDIETNRAPKDRAFIDIRRRFTKYLNDSLPTYGYVLERAVVIPPDFQIQECRYAKIHYESVVDWRLDTDHLRCNPQFHGSERYDSALIQMSPTETAFVHLIFMFTCDIPGVASFDFALVQPLTARTGVARRIDRDLRLRRVKAVPRRSSIFIPIKSIIRGAVMVPDTDHLDEYFVFEHLDHDLFVRMNQDALDSVAI